MAVVISLNRFLAPVDDTVTAQLQSQVTSHKSGDGEAADWALRKMALLDTTAIPLDLLSSTESAFLPRALRAGMQPRSVDGS